MNTYRIPEVNIERLNKLATRISKKCAKYGCEFHYAEIGEEFETIVEKDGSEHVERFVIVECEGIAKINDWVFVGAIDFTENGNVIRKIADIEVPDKYRNTASICEHCHSNRPRKYGYIIYNEVTGEFKQVGTACLRDFTGGLSIEVASMFMSFYDEAKEAELEVDDWFVLGNPVNYLNTNKILAYAIDIVKNLGYQSCYVDGEYHYNGSTKEMVLNSWDYDNGRASDYVNEMITKYRTKFSPNYDSQSLVEEVSAVKEYIINADADNDYMKNLQILAKNEYVSFKQLGLLISMVPCYNRHLEKIARDVEIAKQNEKDMTSSFIGEVGERITINNPTVTTITSWSNAFGGSTIRYKIVDENNNVYMWDCSSWIDSAKIVDTIVGTIKKHDTYNGVNQTWITRCKVTYKKREEVFVKGLDIASLSI